MAPVSPAAARRRALPIAIFAISGLATVFLGANLTSFHVPFQSSIDRTAQLASDLNLGQGWYLIHVLSASCACSQRVAHHLIERGPLLQAQERILLVGQDPELSRELRTAGYDVRSANGDVLAHRYGLYGAPWLLVVSPPKRVAYQGGYARDIQAASGMQDVHILHTLQEGRSAAALPVFGCAIGTHLQKRMDPLSLKYEQ